MKNQYSAAAKRRDRYSQPQFPVREPIVSKQVTASPPYSISRKVVVVVVVIQNII